MVLSDYTILSGSGLNYCCRLRYSQGDDRETAQFSETRPGDRAIFDVIFEIWNVDDSECLTII